MQHHKLQKKNIETWNPDLQKVFNQPSKAKNDKARTKPTRIDSGGKKRDINSRLKGMHFFPIPRVPTYIRLDAYKPGFALSRVSKYVHVVDTRCSYEVLWRSSINKPPSYNGLWKCTKLTRKLGHLNLDTIVVNVVHLTKRTMLILEVRTMLNHCLLQSLMKDARLSLTNGKSFSHKRDPWLATTCLSY